MYHNIDYIPFNKIFLFTEYLVRAVFLENVYNYLMERLLEANLKKDKEILEEVLTHLRTMRDTWKEVMEQNKIAKAN